MKLFVELVEDSLGTIVENQDSLENSLLQELLTTNKLLRVMGQGGGLVVSTLDFCSDDLSSILAGY